MSIKLESLCKRAEAEGRQLFKNKPEHQAAWQAGAAYFAALVAEAQCPEGIDLEKELSE